ncbi:MAG: RluA family pseudouridine synthase [Acidimicrobiia bacterium]
MGITEDSIEAVVPDRLNGARADKAVAELMAVSRSIARSMLEGGDATFDGEVVAPSFHVNAGAELIARLPQQTTLQAESIDFDVLYEDDDLAVIDKPPRLVVHPGAGNQTGTLAAGLLARWPQIEGVGEPNRWGIVHRLDRDTSGAMLVAKTAAAHTGLTEALAARRVHRTYTALVVGAFEIPTGTIDAPLGRDPGDPTRFTITVDGRQAITHYEAVASYSGVTLLSVSLETGRTHQIRVHLASIGHPVCGDRVYGSGGGPAVPRIFLHASSLEFAHPLSGREVTARAQLPDDLAQALAALGN